MDLSKMCPKEKMRYEVAMEVKEDFVNKLNKDIVVENFEEILYMISRAEYKRGKADGISEANRSWRETINIMCDDKTMEGIKKSLRQIQEGKTIPLSELNSSNVQEENNEKD